MIANGEDVAPAGDAIVQDGVVMAPIPGPFEPLGVRATWDARTRVLTLQSPAGDEMELRAVGSPHIPAVLVETAFVTNPREEQLLRDPAAQQTFAQGILKGLQRYVAAPAAAQP